MGLFSGWFGRKRGPASHDAAGVPGSIPGPARSIRYDAGLVSSLKGDHADLFGMYGQLGQDVRAGDYQRVPNALLAFKTRLEAHLLIENVRFYVYLEQSMAGDSGNIAVIREFRREMNGIARRVMEFVRCYQQQHVHAGNQADFIREYEEIGRLLAMRIEHEEGSLYPLYQP